MYYNFINYLIERQNIVCNMGTNANYFPVFYPFLTTRPLQMIACGICMHNNMTHSRSKEKTGKPMLLHQQFLTKICVE